MKIIKNKNLKHKRVIIVIIILLFLCLIGFALFYVLKIKEAAVSTDTNGSSATSSNKFITSAIDKTNDTSTTNSVNEVSMIIVDASKYDSIFEVRAYASDVVEDGTCTFTFTNGVDTVTKTLTATAGANTTSCATMDIAINELSASNSWALKLTYTSTSGNYSGEISKDIQI